MSTVEHIARLQPRPRWRREIEHLAETVIRRAQIDAAALSLPSPDLYSQTVAALGSDPLSEAGES